jgi:hypothetical protein
MSYHFRPPLGTPDEHPGVIFEKKRATPRKGEVARVLQVEEGDEF